MYKIQKMWIAKRTRDLAQTTWSLAAMPRSSGGSYLTEEMMIGTFLGVERRNQRSYSSL